MTLDVMNVPDKGTSKICGTMEFLKCLFWYKKLKLYTSKYTYI